MKDDPHVVKREKRENKNIKNNKKTESKSLEGM